uniref:Threonine dehydratase n=1 Tax=Solibacter usitatus (strain Ellin6076) TaxID=234267 RepID=Q01UD2_SOLUE
MSETHQQHSGAHGHQHGPNCGHLAVQHDGHIDYLHDGHLHHSHGDHVDDHRIEVTSANPEKCTQGHKCSGHEKSHAHGPNCGHEAVPHGNHVDYLVDGHLHHSHGTHCDDHGNLQVAVGTSRGAA